MYKHKFGIVTSFYNTEEFVDSVFESILNQTYENKELIFVYEDNNQYIDVIKSTFNSKLIKYIEVPSIPKKTLGELRNISIDKSNGTVLLQWDDDDIYHKTRILSQYTFMNKINANAVMLDQRLLLIDDVLYKTNIWPFEGSMMIKKKIFTENIIHRYTEANKGEDTNILMELLKTNNIEFMSCPYLYLYRYTGDNVWNKEHFDEIIKVSTKLKYCNDNINILSEINNFNTIINKSNLNNISVFNCLKRFY